MTAAIGIANDPPLFTCNPDDFEGIEGLTVIALPHPDDGSCVRPGILRP